MYDRILGAGALERFLYPNKNSGPPAGFSVSPGPQYPYPGHFHGGGGHGGGGFPCLMTLP